MFTKTLPILLAATIVSATAAGAADLDPVAKDALLAALDDEYHAEAVYKAAIAAGYGKPFTNIIGAEQTHSGKVADLLRKYAVPVPANGYLDGSKPLEPLPATRTETCRMGVEAEIANVALYDKKLLPAVKKYPDVTQVFNALRDASESKHLPAFQRCAGGKGQGKG